eukprot:CAMPEP_0171299628 /NCGR_PEP_ID=MMETSP0816-20121228/8467_1 /TAXON_ID=420281 /ORGANISM="Proboscia inermis, Strain CCAP1064/1" /LENGTH=279 /DNA_ID=CAMNT_0011775579 /DNA_START=104 /DNA_END=943 /DNA_ORIENTATION=+
MGVIEAPYFDIFATAGDVGVLELPLDSDKRAIIFAVAHFGFFMLNFINVSYLVLVEGIALRNLGKNFLHKMCLAGCALQICSCFTSMWRENINDEYNAFWSGGGTFFSNFGFALCSSAVSVVWFHASKNRIKWWTITAIGWLLFHNVNSVISYMQWDEKHFGPFRPMVVIAALYQSIVMIYCFVQVKKGAIVVNPEAASKDQFERICLTMIAANVVAIGLTLLNMPMFKYPQTGWIYCTCVVFCKFAGQMDFAKTTSFGGVLAAFKTEGTAGEKTELLV